MSRDIECLESGEGDGDDTQVSVKATGNDNGNDNGPTSVPIGNSASARSTNFRSSGLFQLSSPMSGVSVMSRMSDENLSVLKEARYRLLLAWGQHRRDFWVIVTICVTFGLVYYTTNARRDMTRVITAVNGLGACMVLGSCRGFIGIWLPVLTGSQKIAKENPKDDSQEGNAQGGTNPQGTTSTNVMGSGKTNTQPTNQPAALSGTNGNGVSVDDVNMIAIVGNKHPEAGPSMISDNNSATPLFAKDVLAETAVVTVQPESDGLASSAMNIARLDNSSPVHNKKGRQKRKEKTVNNKTVNHPLTYRQLRFNTIFNMVFYGMCGIIFYVYFILLTAIFGDTPEDTSNPRFILLSIIKTSFDMLFIAPLVFVPMHQLGTRWRDNFGKFYPTHVMEAGLFTKRGLLKEWFIPGWMAELVIVTPCLLLIFLLPHDLQAVMALGLGTIALIFHASLAGYKEEEGVEEE